MPVTNSNEHNYVIHTVRAYIDELISKVVDKATGNTITDSKTAINNNDSSEDDDEYFKQIERRNKLQDNNNKIASIVNNTISCKFANKFSESTKVRIYLLNTQNYIDLPVSINDTVRDLKRRILDYIEKESKTKIRYHIIDGIFTYLHYLAYEIRMIDDDDDDILPNMELPAFDDKLNIVKSKNDTMAFVEKINFNPEVENSSVNHILGSTVKNSEMV